MSNVELLIFNFARPLSKHLTVAGLKKTKPSTFSDIVVKQRMKSAIFKSVKTKEKYRWLRVDDLTFTHSWMRDNDRQFDEMAYMLSTVIVFHAFANQRLYTFNSDKAADYVLPFTFCEQLSLHFCNKFIKRLLTKHVTIIGLPLTCSQPLSII